MRPDLEVSFVLGVGSEERGGPRPFQSTIKPPLTFTSEVLALEVAMDLASAMTVLKRTGLRFLDDSRKTGQAHPVMRR